MPYLAVGVYEATFNEWSATDLHIATQQNLPAEDYISVESMGADVDAKAKDGTITPAASMRQFYTMLSETCRCVISKHGVRCRREG